MRNTRLGAVLLSLMLVIAACATDTEPPTDTEPTDTTEAPTDTTAPVATTEAPPAESDGRLVVGQAFDPRLLTPWTSVAAEIGITSQMFEKLIAFDADTREFVPVLAEGWEWIDDITLEIRIRPGTVFSNGEILDADAAVFSLNELLNPDTGGFEQTARIANMDRVEKVDDMTVRLIHTEAISQSLNLSNLAITSWMVPPAYYQEVGYENFVEAPIGSGPFVLVDRVRDSQIVFEPNPTYGGLSGPAPEFHTLEFRILPEPGARVAALQAGDVDLIVDLPLEEVDRLDGMPGISVVSIPGLRVMEIQVDMIHGMSEASVNPLVRRALLHAIDRQLIIDTIFDGQGVPVNQLGTPAYFGYVDSLEDWDYDPGLVQELLTEAGYPDGVELGFSCSSGRYLKDREVCEAIGAELAKVGITVPVEILEGGAFLDGVVEGTAGPMIYIGRLSPSLHMVDMMASSTCGRASYKCDEEVDALHAAARAEPDPDRQEQLIEELVRLDFEDPARIPLWVTNDAYAVSDRVQGWAPRADQVLEFWGVSLSD